MNSVIVLMITLSFLLFFMALGYLLYEYVYTTTNRKYVDVYNDYRRKKDQMHKCPKGCVRGVCEYGQYCRDHFPPNPKCCAFNFQCMNCKDRKTGDVYRPDDEVDLLASINHQYYKADTPGEIKQLNREIARQNQYIEKVNRKIRRDNQRFIKTVG